MRICFETGLEIGYHWLDVLIDDESARWWITNGEDVHVMCCDHFHGRFLFPLERSYNRRVRGVGMVKGTDFKLFLLFAVIPHGEIITSLPSFPQLSYSGKLYHPSDTPRVSPVSAHLRFDVHEAHDNTLI